MATSADIATLGIDFQVYDQMVAPALKKNLSQIEKFSKQASKIFSSITNSLVGGIVKVGREFVSEFDSITKALSKDLGLSRSFNLPISQLEALRYAANKANTSSEILDQSLNHMVRNLGRAGKSADSDPAKALKTLGLSINDLNKMDAAGQILAIANAMKQLPRSEQSLVAYRLFEETGVKFLGVLNSDLESAINNFYELGLGTSEFQARSVMAFTTAQRTFATIWDQFKRQIVLGLLDPFTEFIKLILQTIKEMGGVRNAAKQVSSAILFFVATMIQGIGYLLQSLGMLVKFLDTVIKKYQEIKDRAADVNPFNIPSTVNKKLSGGLDWLFKKSIGLTLDKATGSPAGTSKLTRPDTSPQSNWMKWLNESSNNIQYFSDKLVNLAYSLKTTQDNFADSVTNSSSTIAKASMAYSEDIRQAGLQVKNAFDDLLTSQSDQASKDLISKIWEGVPQPVASDRADFTSTSQMLLREAMKLRQGKVSGSGSITDATGKKIWQVQETARQNIANYFGKLQSIVSEEMAAGRDPTALLNVMKELKGFVDNSPQDRIIKVQIIADKNNLVKAVVTSDDFINSSGDVVAAWASREAQETAL